MSDKFYLVSLSSGKVSGKLFTPDDVFAFLTEHYGEEVHRATIERRTYGEAAQRRDAKKRLLRS